MALHINHPAAFEPWHYSIASHRLEVDLRAFHSHPWSLLSTGPESLARLHPHNS